MEEDTRVFPVVDDEDKEYEIVKEKKFIYETPASRKLIIPANGDCATIPEMEELRNKLLKIAIPFGYPNMSIKRDESSLIDKKIGELLFKEMNITPSVAASLSMWQFLNLYLVPDLVYWRWGDSKDHFTDRKSVV